MKRSKEEKVFAVKMLNVLQHIKYIIYAIGPYFLCEIGAVFSDIKIKGFIIFLSFIVYVMTYKYIDLNMIKNASLPKKKFIQKEMHNNKYWVVAILTIMILIVLTNNKIFAMFLGYLVLIVNILKLISFYR